MRNTRHLLISIGATAAILFSACVPTPATSSGSPAASAKSGGTLNIWLTQNLTDLNPLSGTRNAGWFLTQFAYQDELYAVGPDNKYEPRLAQSWDLSSDAMTYTFHLRQGLKWSDGEPFSSKDVLFSWGLYMNPASSDLAGTLTEVKGASDYAKGITSTPAGLSAPDANTFVIQLATPDSTFLSNFYWPPLPILPEHVLGTVAPSALKTNSFFVHPTASMGPFKFVQWQTNQFVELERNPNYWKPVHIDRVFLRIMDANVAAAAMQTGDLDLISTGGATADRLAKLSNVKVVSATSPGINKMTFTPEKPPFNDVRVRQAFMYAIDREGIIKTVYSGRGQVVNTDLRAPNTVASDLESYAYNPQKAKDLLTQANWDPNFVFKLGWPNTQTDRAATATIMQANLGAVGVKVELDPLDSATFRNFITDRKIDGGLVDGGIYNVDGNSAAPGLDCTQFSHSPGSATNGGNLAWYCNKQVDALFAQARTIADDAKRNGVYQQISKIVNTEVSYLWLNASDSVYAESNRLQGFKGPGDNTTFTVDIADWSLQ